MKEGLMYKLAPGGWSGGQVRYPTQEMKYLFFYHSIHDFLLSLFLLIFLDISY